MNKAKTIIRRNSADHLNHLDHLPPILRRVYSARNITTAAELSVELKTLHSFDSLKGIQSATTRLAQALRQQQHILIVGDFDADGATSTALMLRCLRSFGFAEVDYLVPNRFDFGYGLTPEIVAVAAKTSPALIVTVDNGISSAAGVEQARRAGIDVLITDHHLPPSELPEANVIVNPNVPAGEDVGQRPFGSRHLAGVGVAFYVMAALGRALEDAGNEGAARVPARYLDLVALGTVADVGRAALAIGHGDGVGLTAGQRRDEQPAEERSGHRDIQRRFGADSTPGSDAVSRRAGAGSQGWRRARRSSGSSPG